MSAGSIMGLCRAGLALLGSCALLASCGNQDEGPGTLSMLRQAAGQITAQMRGTDATDTAAAPADPEAMAAEALQVNPGPLVLAGLEGMGTTQVLAMTGENQGMRTYMTPAMQALILRDGLLIGTRGLGHDLSTSEIGTEALIRTRQAGSAQHMLRIYSGDGRELPLPLTCEVSRGPDKSFAFAGRQWNTTTVVEACHNGALRIENNYLVTSGGEIPLSRQWAGPGLGYITLQTIRP